MPTDPATRGIAKALFGSVEHRPILRSHGHNDPRWNATDEAFPGHAQLFVTPNHYVLRSPASQGVALTDLGVLRADAGPTETGGRKNRRLFAQHDRRFRDAPSRPWPDHALLTMFGMTERSSAATADVCHDRIAACLASSAYRPVAVVDPAAPGFADKLARLGEVIGEVMDT